MRNRHRQRRRAAKNAAKAARVTVLLNTGREEANVRKIMTVCLAGAVLAAAVAAAEAPVTAVDLRHHRWVLASIDGEPLPAAEVPGKTPELDFGEQSFVSGSLGCNRFSGQAVLRDDSFLVESMISTRMACDSPWSEIEQKMQLVLAQASTITIDTERRLSLQTADTTLVFDPRDWVR